MTSIAESAPLATSPRPTGFDEVLELPYSVALRASAAMLAVMSDDKITPSLCNALFDGEKLYATDRYRAARFDLPATPPRSDDRLLLGEQFLIPAGALRWVTRVQPDKGKARTKLATMSDGGYTIRFTKINDLVAVELIDMFGAPEDEASFAIVPGHYPPVRRLFGEIPDAPAGVVTCYDPKLLGDILTWATRHGGGECVHIRPSTVKENGTPQATSIICAAATFLIQPRLTTR